MSTALFSAPDLHWTPVSWQLRVMRRILVGWGFALLAAVLVAVDRWLVPLPEDVVRGGVGAVAGLGVVLWVLVGRAARSWGYAERAADLYIRRGAVVRQMVAVPYGRMQLVEVTAGPVEQLFGLSSVRLHTASAHSRTRIPGLTPREAARLRDRLTELGEAQAAGL